MKVINTTRKGIISFCFCTVLTACLAVFTISSKAEVVDDTIASVNGEPLLLSEYKKNIESVMVQYKRAMPEFFTQKNARAQLREKVLNQMIDDTLLYQQAKKDNIKIRSRELDMQINETKKRFTFNPVTGKPLSKKEAEKAFKDELKKSDYTYKQYRKLVERKLMVDRLIRDKITPKVKHPTDGEVKKFFDTIQSVIKNGTDTLKGMTDEYIQQTAAIAQKFKEFSAERVRVRHILIKADENASIIEKNKALSKAKDIKQKIDKGADFGDTAVKYSEDTESAVRGGDIGFIIKGWMPEKFENMVFSLGVGEAGGPVETKFGYHIIWVEEKKAAQNLKFETIKKDIAQYMTSRQLQKELINYVKYLRKKANIIINKKKA